jgi:hypothetical protein
MYRFLPSLLLIAVIITSYAVGPRVAPAKEVDGFLRDVQDGLSDDSELRRAAVARLRASGPDALRRLTRKRDQFLLEHALHAVAPSRADSDTKLKRWNELIDEVGGQRYCSVSRLYWHTDMDQAQSEAQRAGKPILSLRLLGNLTDEFSCANSRFFRTTLYANADISRYLREHFVLHWQSVRPVPRITIDFGDGRKLERTITGNSIHYLLHSDGQPIDALPGLYGPASFLQWLERMKQAATTFAALDRQARVSWLSGWKEITCTFLVYRFRGLIV